MTKSILKNIVYLNIIIVLIWGLVRNKYSAFLTLSLLSATTSLNAGFDFDKVKVDFKDPHTVHITLKKESDSNKKKFKNINHDEGLWWNGATFQIQKQESILKLDDENAKLELTINENKLNIIQASGLPNLTIESSSLPVVFNGPTEFNSITVKAPQSYNKKPFKAKEFKYEGWHFVIRNGFRAQDFCIEESTPTLTTTTQTTTSMPQPAAQPPAPSQNSQPIKQEESLEESKKTPIYFTVKSTFDRPMKMSLTYNLLQGQAPTHEDPRIEFNVPANGSIGFSKSLP